MAKIRPMRLWCILGIVSVVLLLNGAAWGTLLTIVNPSFETNVLPSGIYISTATGWSGAGTWHPLNPERYFYVFPPDGNNVGWTNNGTISQTLNDTLVADAAYTLTVYVGYRLDYGVFNDTIALYAGTNLLASESATAPLKGYWQEETLTFHSTSSTPGLGERLVIKLSSSAGQGDFDKISLDCTPSAPLPGTILLLGSGMLGLIGWRRRLS